VAMGKEFLGIILSLFLVFMTASSAQQARQSETFDSRAFLPTLQIQLQQIRKPGQESGPGLRTVYLQPGW
jgi:hypothetical protein